MFYDEWDISIEKDTSEQYMGHQGLDIKCKAICQTLLVQKIAGKSTK